jgi:site-specific DNA recombinase
MNATSSSRRRVGLWVRVSTEMQAQGDSPETHERRAREYAAGRGWDVATVYRLHGVSGAVSLAHPEAARMLADVESGRITARIARDGIQFRLLHRSFRAAGADLISLDENIDTSTASGPRSGPAPRPTAG